MTVAQEWIDNGKPFEEGVTIYEQSGFADLSYLKFFEGEETPEKMMVLERELHRIDRMRESVPTQKNEVTAKAPVVVKVKDANAIVKVIRGEVKPEDMPDDIRAIWEDNGNIYKEMKELHEKIKDKNTKDEEAKVLIEQLCAVEDKYNSNWDTIDAWYIKSIEDDPERDKKELALTVHKLTVRKANLENYLRRYKGNKEKQDEYVKQLEQVKQTLSNLVGQSIK